MFSFLNRGLDYEPPKERVVMPTGKLLAYAQPHIMPYVVYGICTAVLAKIINPYQAYIFAFVLTLLTVGIYYAKGEYPEFSLKGLKFGDWLLAFAIGVVGIVLWILPYHFAWKVMFARIPVFGNENIYLSLTYGFEFAEDAFHKAQGALILLPSELPKSSFSAQILQIGAEQMKDFLHLNMDSGVLANILLAIRIAGAAIMVPFFEELFSRSALTRFCVAEQYKEVPIGYYTKKSFLIAIGFFILSHPWWFVALIWGGLIFFLYYYKKSIPLCIFAHGVSNLLLGLYVVATGNYYLW